MDVNDFVVAMLGLQDVVVEKCEFSEKSLSAVVTVRQNRKSCVCPKCEGPLFGVKQWKKRRLWGIPLGSFLRVEVIFYHLQAACGRCMKHRLAQAAYIHPRFKQFTCAFSEHVGRWMEETTCMAVHRVTGAPVMSLWRLDQWRMKEMKKRYKIPEKMKLRLMSADEVHMRTVRPPKRKYDKAQWKKVFITNLVSYEHSAVLANAKGRDARSLKTCLKQLTETQRQQIRYIAVDMHDGFIRAAEKLCPNAKVVVDRFHVAEGLNRAFNKVRQAEFEKAKENQDPFQKEMLMPSKRFIFMERQRDLSKKDQGRLDRIRKLNHNINTGMMLVEYFHAVLDKKNVQDYRKGLELWMDLVETSDLEPLKDFANTVVKYHDRIETYIESHLTTAVSEGLNNKIKVFKRAGYCYTNQDSFMNKILQRAGHLNSRFMNTKSWFWGLGTIPHPTI